MLLLTYSRFGVALAVAAAAGWIVLDRDRVESLVAAALAAAAGAGAFGVALVLPGITKDGQSHAIRVHDGWIFGLVVLALGAVVFGVALALARAETRRPLAPERRRRVERIAALAALLAVFAGIALSAAFAQPDLARVHQSRLQPDLVELTGPARQPQLEQPLALVDGGMERLHEPSARRHRAPAPSSSPTCACASAR